MSVRFPGMFVLLLLHERLEVFNEIGAFFRVGHADRHHRARHALSRIGNEFVEGAPIPKDARFAQRGGVLKTLEDAGLAPD